MIEKIGPQENLYCFRYHIFFISHFLSANHIFEIWSPTAQELKLGFPRPCKQSSTTTRHFFQGLHFA